MKKALLLLSLFFFSCKTKPFVKVDVKAEKLMAECSKKSEEVALNSNIGGERFEFEECLAYNFDSKLVTADRKGDTLVVNIPRPGVGVPRSLYKLTMDVDAYPRYGFIAIGENTFTIVAAKN